MNEICKGESKPRLNTKTKLGRVMKLTSIPLFVFTTGVYASVHSPNMRIKSDIMIIEKPSTYPPRNKTPVRLPEP